MKYTSFLIVSVIIISCNSKSEKEPGTIRFDITHKSVELDTLMDGVVFYNNLFICNLQNRKIVVFDSNLVRNKIIESFLDSIHPQFIYIRNDSVIFSALKDKNKYESYNFELFSLTKNSKLSPINKATVYPEAEFYGDKYFEDSNYLVFGCCAGEWGGSLYFLNKKTNKLHFLVTGCVMQVLKFQDYYYITEGPDYANFIRLQYPDSLAELPLSYKKSSCNWWTSSDSLKAKYSQDRKKIPGLMEYHPEGITSCLTSFINNNRLFSILTRDSLTFIGMHSNNTIQNIQNIFDRRLLVHYTTNFNNDSLILFRAEIGIGTEPITNISNSGFIRINGTSICILENQKNIKEYYKRF